jgi:hypothetical protein
MYDVLMLIIKKKDLTCSEKKKSLLKDMPQRKNKRTCEHILNKILIIISFTSTTYTVSPYAMKLLGMNKRGGRKKKAVRRALSFLSRFATHTHIHTNTAQDQGGSSVIRFEITYSGAQVES